MRRTDRAATGPHRAIIAVATVALALASVALTAVPASAHNGVGAAFKGRAGPYVVYAYDGYIDRPGQLAYQLIVLDGRTLDPVYGVRPSVSASPLARNGHRAATGRVTPYGNVFFYGLPNPYPGHWLVHLLLTGPRGRGRVDFRMHGAMPAGPTAAAPLVTVSSDGVGWAPVAGGVAVLAALAAAGALLLRRRRSANRVATRTPGGEH